MNTATLSPSGTITIPISIRRQIGLKAGDPIHFTVLAGGVILLRVKRGSASRLQGMPKPRRRLHSSELSR